MTRVKVLVYDWMRMIINRNLHLFKEQGLIDERHLGQAHCSYEMKRLGEHQHLM